MTDFDWDRLARYVSGESGAAERADIERWAASSDANRAMLESLKRRWTAAGDGTSWNAEAAWAKLAPRLKDVVVEPAVVDIRSRVPARSRWTRITRLVPLAAAAVLLVAVAVQLSNRSEPTGGRVALTTSDMRTGVGEQRTYELSDGSSVVLGAASSLRVAEGFGTRTREVFLEGQAFLRVVHDSTRPFVVNAAGTRTVDLGTAFEVRAYPNEVVRVVVTEGMVAVRRESGIVGDSAVLQPGDVAEVPTTGETVVKQQVNVERLLGWTRGKLIFDDTPLGDAARDLERWFDVQVRFDDPALRTLRWNAEPRIGDSLDTILEVIETTFQAQRVRAERNGNVITIRRGPPVNPTANPSSTRNRVEAGA